MHGIQLHEDIFFMQLTISQKGNDLIFRPMHTKPLPCCDLDHIWHHTSDLWNCEAESNFFITGGTGFFGIWLLESLAHANQIGNLNLRVVVLSRNPEAFLSKMPHLVEHSFIHWIKGDIRNFDFPQESFDYLVHAATDTLSRNNFGSQLMELDGMISGTKRVLEFARCAGVRKLLFTSSGAVYGQQDSSHIPVSEDCMLSPDPLSPRSSYGIGKRVSEHLCMLHSLDTGCQISLARCFAFIGPHLPLDQGYAIGNFLRDGLNGEPIRFTGTGQSVRSYLHAADLMIWLWTLLFKAEGCRAYNVGSPTALTIAQAAEMVAANFSLPTQSQIAGNVASSTSVYLPDVSRAALEHNLEEKILLPEAIRRTSQWYLTN